MFNLVHQRVANAVPYHPFPENTEQCKAELARRTQTATQFVKDLGAQAGVDSSLLDSYKVSFTPSFGPITGKVDLFNKSMHLPTLLFLDFPRDFGARDLPELKQRLSDLPYAQTFSDRYSHIFDTLPIQANEKIRMTFQNIMDYMMQDPEKALNAERFGILFQLGLLKNNSFRSILMQSLRIAAIATVVFGLVTIAVWSLSQMVFLTYMVGAAAATFIALLEANKASKERLIAADRFAMSALPGQEGEKIRQGAIYLLDWTKRVCDDPSSPSWAPSIEERMQLFRNFQPA